MQVTNQFITMIADLEACCQSKDSQAIRKQVEAIRRAGLTKYLQSEMHEALYLAESLEREPFNPNILDMGKKMMTEIRRYQNPNPVMHRIMQGAFLMLGEDEDTTDVRCFSVILATMKSNKTKTNCETCTQLVSLNSPVEVQLSESSLMK